VRDAAYHARARQLEVRAATERTATAIRRAKTAGEPTAVIWSEGDKELWPPYRRVEMSVSTGNAVAVTTVMDPDTMMPRYALEALALDPESGEALDEEPLSPRREFTDPDEWRAAAEALRAALLR
jgi:hypothetical protein